MFGYIITNHKLLFYLFFSSTSYTQSGLCEQHHIIIITVKINTILHCVHLHVSPSLQYAARSVLLMRYRLLFPASFCLKYEINECSIRPAFLLVLRVIHIILLLLPIYYPYLGSPGTTLITIIIISLQFLRTQTDGGWTSIILIIISIT